MQLIYQNNMLIHHGIKGQKWGVKNGPPYPLHKSTNRKIDIKIRINNDGSSTVPKGFEFDRVGKNQLDPNGAGALYVSYGKSDASRYIKNLGPTPFRKIIKMYGANSQKLKAINDIRIASKKQLSSMISNSLYNNSEIRKAINESLYSMMLDKNWDNKLETYINNPSSDEAMKLAYAVSSMFGDPSYYNETKQLFDDYKSKGFDAIPDLQDIMTGTSKTATIIINTNKIKTISVNPISKSDMKKAKQYVKSLEKLKVSDIIA